MNCPYSSGKVIVNCQLSTVNYHHMNIYSELIFPRLIDRVMNDRDLNEYRGNLLAAATGEVLEIGFGTGLNLPYYPIDRISRIVTCDPNPGMKKIAATRIAASEIEVEYLTMNGEKLPFVSDRFDTVVSTWTLCSIKAVDLAISEIYRVLKPGGQFLFIEHGLADDTNIQKWQRRLNPIQKIIADGCHLDRQIDLLVGKQFNRLNIAQFYVPDRPKIGSYFYCGTGIKLIEN
jgi:SAM-dependent methyltransferase